MNVSICACPRPDEQPDNHCGDCGHRRLGDDLTPTQLADLTQELLRLFAPDTDAEPVLARYRGRKRHRTVTRCP